MSVSQVILSSLGAEGEAKGDTALSVTGSYTANYRVKCDSASDDPSIVLAYFRSHSQYPWLGRPYKFGNGFDTSVVCKTVKANYVEKSGGWFNVPCTFESLTAGQDNQGGGRDIKGKEEKDPTKWHDEIELTFNTIMVPAEKGIYRKTINGTSSKFTADKERAITDSAGVPFNPTLERPVSIRVIRITRQSKSCDPEESEKYIDSVNEDEFTIDKPDYGFKYKIGQYKALCKQFSATYGIENSIPFWRETIELHVHPKDWRHEILDRSLHRRLGYGDTDDSGHVTTYPESIAANFVSYTKIRDKDGTPLSDPVPLDGNGKVLGTGKPHVYLVYSIENEIPFSPIKW